MVSYVYNIETEYLKYRQSDLRNTKSAQFMMYIGIEDFVFERCRQASFIQEEDKIMLNKMK